MQTEKVNVDLWYFGSTKAPNGVSSFIKVILDGFANDEVINVNLFSNDNITIRSEKNTPFEIFKIRSKKAVHTALFYFSSKINILGWLHYIIKFRNAQKVIKRYPKSKPGTVLFFQDIITAYQYIKIYGDFDNPSLMVLHSSGDPLKMIFETYPQLSQNKRFTKFMQTVATTVFQQINTIVLLSESAQSTFSALYPEHTEKITVIYNGIGKGNVDNHEKKNQHQEEDILTFVSVGSISKRKGFDLLIDAIKLLPQEVADQIRVKIIGDGPLRNKLIEQCEQHNLNAVKFLGVQRNVEAILSSCDVFVLVSRDEGMPIALIEAFRAGLPALVTNVGAMGGMVTDEYNGYVCSTNELSIRDGITWIVNNRKALSEMRQNSHKEYEQKYTLDSMLYAYKQAFLTTKTRHVDG